jgi:hemolysin-activating ACP:hemolysin acyltransferase
MATEKVATGSANNTKVVDAKVKPKQASPLEARQKAMMARLTAASFGEIVTLMMRTPRYRQMPLESLEASAAAPVALGQVMIAQAQDKKSGAAMPIAAVMWAFVTPEVDRRLSDLDQDATTLAVSEWRSGSIPWIIEAIGDRRAIARLLRQLIDTTFKDNVPKIRTTAADGKPMVGRIARA